MEDRLSTSQSLMGVNRASFAIDALMIACRILVELKTKKEICIDALRSFAYVCDAFTALPPSRKLN